MSKDIKDEELYSQLYNIIQSAVRNEVERAMQEKDDKAQHDITQDNKITKASEKQVDSYIIGGETEEDMRNRVRKNSLYLIKCWNIIRNHTGRIKKESGSA